MRAHPAASVRMGSSPQGHRAGHLGDMADQLGHPGDRYRVSARVDRCGRDDVLCRLPFLVWQVVRDGCGPAVGQASGQGMRLGPLGPHRTNDPCGLLERLQRFGIGVRGPAHRGNPVPEGAGAQGQLEPLGCPAARGAGVYPKVTPLTTRLPRRLGPLP